MGPLGQGSVMLIIELRPQCEPTTRRENLAHQPSSLTLGLILRGETDTSEPPYLVQMFQGSPSICF